MLRSTFLQLNGWSEPLRSSYIYRSEVFYFIRVSEIKAGNRKGSNSKHKWLVKRIILIGRNCCILWLSRHWDLGWWRDSLHIDGFKQLEEKSSDYDSDDEERYDSSACVIEFVVSFDSEEVAVGKQANGFNHNFDNEISGDK